MIDDTLHEYVVQFYADHLEPPRAGGVHVFTATTLGAPALVRRIWHRQRATDPETATVQMLVDGTGYIELTDREPPVKIRLRWRRSTAVVDSPHATPRAVETEKKEVTL